jgi:hypothetical protein
MSSGALSCTILRSVIVVASSPRGILRGAGLRLPDVRDYSWLAIRVSQVEHLRDRASRQEDEAAQRTGRSRRGDLLAQDYPELPVQNVQAVELSGIGEHLVEQVGVGLRSVVPSVIACPQSESNRHWTDF